MAFAAVPSSPRRYRNFRGAPVAFAALPPRSWCRHRLRGATNHFASVFPVPPTLLWLRHHIRVPVRPPPQVRDVRIISDRNSRRSKGIAYVEFCEIQSVPLAIGLTGQRLLGVPIIVQASQVGCVCVGVRNGLTWGFGGAEGWFCGVFKGMGRSPRGCCGAGGAFLRFGGFFCGLGGVFWGLGGFLVGFGWFLWGLGGSCGVVLVRCRSGGLKQS